MFVVLNRYVVHLVEVFPLFVFGEYIFMILFLFERDVFPLVPFEGGVWASGDTPPFSERCQRLAGRGRAVRLCWWPRTIHRLGAGSAPPTGITAVWPRLSGQPPGVGTDADSDTGAR